MKNDKKRINNIEEDLDQVKDDIEYLYNILQPELPEVSNEDDATVAISKELYEVLYKYCENKKFIFMGVA